MLYDVSSCMTMLMKYKKTNKLFNDYLFLLEYQMALGEDNFLQYGIVEAYMDQWSTLVI